MSKLHHWKLGIGWTGPKQLRKVAKIWMCSHLGANSNLFTSWKWVKAFQTINYIYFLLKSSTLLNYWKEYSPPIKVSPRPKNMLVAGYTLLVLCFNFFLTSPLHTVGVATCSARTVGPPVSWPGFVAAARWWGSALLFPLTCWQTGVFIPNVVEQEILLPYAGKKHHMCVLHHVVTVKG